MTTFYDEAKKLMFTTKVSVEDLLGDRLVFRKGKDISHINRAMLRARKNGRGKTEIELEELEMGLSSILKLAPKKPKISLTISSDSIS